MSKAEFNGMSFDAFTLEDRVKLIRKYVHDSIPMEMDGWRIIGGDRVSRDARFKAIVDHPGNSNSTTDIVKDELYTVVKSMLYGVPSVHLIDMVSENQLNYHSILMNIYTDIRYKYWDMSPINTKSYKLMDLNRFTETEDLIRIPMLLPSSASEYSEKFDLVNWDTDYKDIVIDKYIRMLPFTLMELLISGYPISTLVNSVSEDLSNHISDFILQTSLAYSRDVTDIHADDFNWQRLANIFNQSPKSVAFIEEYNTSGDLLALINNLEGVESDREYSEMYDDYDYDDSDYATKSRSLSTIDKHIYFKFLYNLLASVYVNENRLNEFVAKLDLPDELMQNISMPDIIEMIHTFKSNDNSELALVYENSLVKGSSKRRRRMGINLSRRRISGGSSEEVDAEYYYPRTLDKMFMLEKEGKLAYGSMLGIDVQHKTDSIVRILN